MPTDDSVQNNTGPLGGLVKIHISSPVSFNIEILLSLVLLFFFLIRDMINLHMEHESRRHLYNVRRE